MGNRATYFGKGVETVIDSDFEGLISDSANYGGGINQIEISHERRTQMADALTAKNNRS